MTIMKIIDSLYFTVGMILFNPLTGEGKTPDQLNEDDRTTYDACMGAIALLKAQEQEIEDLKQEIEGHKDNLRETLDEMMRYADELKAQEPRYPVCERCGKQIDHINTSVFQYDGTDSEYQMPLTFDEKSGCVVFETVQNWTGYELTDEERKEGIRCPNCGEYPFDSSVEIEFHEPVEVLMWTSKRTDDIQREYEAAIEMAEYCERYEPTYNADDGSM